MSLLEPILRELDKIKSSMRGVPVVRWATVTAASPLAVRMDGDVDPLPFPPQSTVAGLTVGERVVCVEQNRRIIIISRVEPAPPDESWKPLTLKAGFVPQTFGYAPSYQIKDDRIYMRGTILKSSGNFAAGDSPFDMPVGVRPGAVIYFVTRGAGAPAFISGQIDVTGVSTLNLPSANTAWMSLDPISFPKA